MILYLDASAVLRVLLREAGPAVARRDEDDAYSSEIVEVEVFRALDRARLAGRIDDTLLARKSKEAADYLRTLRLAAVTREVIDRARASFPVPVRALDALHVATAEWLQTEVGATLAFWTHDAQQARAALCRALEVRGADV